MRFGVSQVRKYENMKIKKPHGRQKKEKNLGVNARLKTYFNFTMQVNTGGLQDPLAASASQGVNDPVASVEMPVMPWPMVQPSASVPPKPIRLGVAPAP